MQTFFVLSLFFQTSHLRERDFNHEVAIIYSISTSIYWEFCILLYLKLCNILISFYFLSVFIYRISSNFRDAQMFAFLRFLSNRKILNAQNYILNYFLKETFKIAKLDGRKIKNSTYFLNFCKFCDTQQKNPRLKEVLIR